MYEYQRWSLKSLQEEERKLLTPNQIKYVRERTAGLLKWEESFDCIVWVITTLTNLWRYSCPTEWKTPQREGSLTVELFIRRLMNDMKRWRTLHLGIAEMICKDDKGSCEYNERPIILRTPSFCDTLLDETYEQKVYED